MENTKTCLQDLLLWNRQNTSNKVVEIWGNGTAIRDYVDVSDVTNVVKNIIDRDIEGKIFNVGSDRYTINKVVQYLEKYTNKVANVVYLEKEKLI